METSFEELDIMNLISFVFLLKFKLKICKFQKYLKMIVSFSMHIKEYCAILLIFTQKQMVKLYIRFSKVTFVHFDYNNEIIRYLIYI